MAITPAHFKKFIAGTTDAVPCAFDPTDGNAILWLNNTPCIYNDKIFFGLIGNASNLGGDHSAGLDGGYMSSKLCLATGDAVGTSVSVDGVTLTKNSVGVGASAVSATIPIWSALAAAAWSGFVAFDLFITTSSALTSKTIRARVDTASTDFATLSWTPTAGTPGACSTDLRATLTVWESGLVTIT